MNVWLHLLTSTPYGNKWPHSRPGHFTPRERVPITPWNRRPSRPHSQARSLEEQTKSLTLTEGNPRFLGLPVRSLLTKRNTLSRLFLMYILRNSQSLLLIKPGTVTSHARLPVTSNHILKL